MSDVGGQRSEAGRQVGLPGYSLYMSRRPALRRRRRSGAGIGLAPMLAIHLSTSFQV